MSVGRFFGVGTSLQRIWIYHLLPVGHIYLVAKGRKSIHRERAASSLCSEKRCCTASLRLISLKGRSWSLPKWMLKMGNLSTLLAALLQSSVFDHSSFLRALLPEATADFLRRRACCLPDTARKMVARLEPTLIGNSAYGQSCLFEQLDPFCYSLLPEIGDGSQRQMLLKEAYQMKRTHR